MKRELFYRIVSDMAQMFGIRPTVEVRKHPCPHGRTCKDRDLAFVEMSEPRLVITERLLSFPRHNIIGVLLHEFGHLADTSDAPGAERRADRIAERVSGLKISYDENDVQTIWLGIRPRPKYLHQ